MPTVKLNARLEKLLTDTEKSLFHCKAELNFIEFINSLEQREHIGDVLLIIRNALNQTLRGLANIIGISHAFLYKLEKRRGAPTLPIAFSIADSLEIPRLRFIWLCARCSKGDNPSLDAVLKTPRQKNVV